MSVRIWSNRHKVLYLDIRYGDGLRSRPSTKLKDTKDNRKLLEKEIIPNISIQVLNGTYNPKSDQVVIPKTIKEYGYLSLKRHKNEKRSHVYYDYVRHFETKIVPYFGNRLVQNISAIELIDWQNDLLETKKASTVKKYRTVFNGIFEDARRELLHGEKLIPSNPFRDVPIPKEAEVFIDDEDEYIDGNIKPFSMSEIDIFISKVNGYLKNFIGIMARSGMRPGELVSLRWKNVDFENEIIKIRKTRVEGSNGPPKKIASRRDIEMLPGVKEYFLNQYALTGTDNGDVFLNNASRPFYSHDIIAKRFKDLLDEGDDRYLYQLRHSFASLMISEGEDILWVSHMLGHKSSDITLKTYAKAYKLFKDKNKRKARALFLSKGHTGGTLNNVTYCKPPTIGEKR